jgi:hypothetical protein
MAPIIEVSDETLKTLNPEVYTMRNDLVLKPEIETPRAEVVSDSYIEVPELNLAIAKERTHQGKDWYEAHRALSQEGARMLTLPEFAGFLKYLKSEESNQEYQEILRDLVEVKSPWRSEWFDTAFKQGERGLYILTQNKSKKEKIRGGLREDKTPGINLEHWLENPTNQGLPKSNVPQGDLYYWGPINGSVARFGAGSGRALLDCDGGPSSAGSDLGVRAAKQLE